jgi:hypothetical protein
MSKKIIYSIILIFLSLLGVFVLNFNKVSNEYSIKNEFTKQIYYSSTQTTLTDTKTKQDSQILIKENQTLKEISVTLIAGSDIYQTSVEENSSVLDVMNTLASTTAFSFKAKYYSGLGFFVNQINGVENANSKYWTLYVNGNYSMVGTSQYNPKEGDRIEWKFEKK